jgi:hypothetical protein
MRVAVNEFAKFDYTQRNCAAESKHVDVARWHIAVALRLLYVGQVINARARGLPRIVLDRQNRPAKPTQGKGSYSMGTVRLSRK